MAKELERQQQDVKKQKQKEFLEENSQCALCASPLKFEHTLEDAVIWERTECPSCNLGSPQTKYSIQ